LSRTVTVFMRFDDYCATSPPAIEQGLVVALRRTGLRATFAVVPALTEGRYHDPGERGTLPMNEAKLAFLREAVTAGVVDAALHGWNHRTRVSAPPHREFDGLDPAVQMDVIGKGAALLQTWTGAAPTVFVPPWNRYDNATLDALAAHGFRCISAHRYGTVGTQPLMFAPITIEMPDLRTAVAAARQAANSDPVIGVLMHPYDFHESGDARATMTLESFGRELDWLVAQPDVRVVSIAQLAAANATMDAERYRANRPHVLEQVAPPFVVRTAAVPYYASRTHAARANTRRAAQTVATHLAAAGGGAAAGAAMHAVVPAGPMVAAALALALAVLVGRALVQRRMYFRTSFAVAVLVGALLTASRGA